MESLPVQRSPRDRIVVLRAPVRCAARRVERWISLKESKVGAMAQIQDIPKLISEFLELVKAYLLQETVEPAKKLGHFAGYSIGAGAIWAVALVLLSVAGLRALIELLPAGSNREYWEALGYVLFAPFLVGFMALMVKVRPDRGVHDGQPMAHESGDDS